ncbi:hypothetical protein [Clostridium luticellarii]|uniref:Uncharacterized protein n=1 Tax=Clostridium luticellarii TaxID=1691940 RepID=A0A2T0BQ77_9CLOT|nr:hypothetical protein [Clostridium luticellarii]PRR85992.1 hypothetical protein CLLU_10200 [Clostridium luticellarii]
MGEISNKEKCFEYFSKYDDKSKDDLVFGVMKEFGTTKNTAQMYYYNWKKEYLKGDIKVVNHNPSAGCKHENKKPLTDEMIIDELKRQKFSSQIGMVMDELDRGRVRSVSQKEGSESREVKGKKKQV